MSYDGLQKENRNLLNLSLEHYNYLFNNVPRKDLTRKQELEQSLIFHESQHVLDFIAWCQIWLSGFLIDIYPALTFYRTFGEGQVSDQCAEGALQATC